MGSLSPRGKSYRSVSVGTALGQGPPAGRQEKEIKGKLLSMTQKHTEVKSSHWCRLGRWWWLVTALIDVRLYWGCVRLCRCVSACTHR